MANQKGFSAIFLMILGVLLVAGVFGLLYFSYFKKPVTPQNQASESQVTEPQPEIEKDMPASSEETSFDFVKERYNLNEEQIDILKKVNPDDKGT